VRADRLQQSFSPFLGHTDSETKRSTGVKSASGCYATGVRDPYDVLDLPREASPEEIKRAFRNLAREHHPDRNPGNDEAHAKFQEINAAYQLLSDPARRARFDRSGFDTMPPPPPPGPSGAKAGVGVGGLEDLLGDLIGALGRRAPQQSGDMQQTVTLTFEEAALGCQKKLRYTRVDLCGSCRGTRAAARSSLKTCGACRGQGRIAVAASGWIAPLMTEQLCQNCAGSGRIPEERCRACKGNGLGPETREVEVTVPPGIEAGASQVISGAGNRTQPGAPAGDLEVVIQIEDHAVFTREGDDVLCDLELAYTVAALGGEVDVHTLHGAQRLRIPEGTPVGAELRLRGLGVPHRFRGGAGDHVARVKLKVPQRLSPRARELVTQFEAEVGPYEGEGLLGKLRNFFSG
jgi:molecular chaperone DnaJ